MNKFVEKNIINLAQSLNYDEEFNSNIRSDTKRKLNLDKSTTISYSSDLQIKNNNQIKIEILNINKYQDQREEFKTEIEF